MSMDTLIRQLVAARAQLDATLAVLIEEQEAGEQQTECTHERRTNLTTMGGLEEWECKDCGFHYIEQENN